MLGSIIVLFKLNQKRYMKLKYRGIIGLKKIKYKKVQERISLLRRPLSPKDKEQ